MFHYSTEFPVFSHRGEEIVSANTVIDTSLLTSLIQRKEDRRPFSIGKDETLKGDLKSIIDKDVYSVIFREKEKRDHFLSAINSIYIPCCQREALEAFEERDFYTYEHLLTVFALSTYLSSLFSREIDPIPLFSGALSHDMGKSSVPLGVLHKEKPLTARERKHVEHHTLAGYLLMVCYSGDINHSVATIARDHHENGRGSGYPVGRKDLDFHTEVVIVCDIYDALLSSRSYRREAFDNRTALEELTRRAISGEISEKVVKALIASNRKKKTLWHECKISEEKRGVYPRENYYGIIDSDL